MTAPLLATLAGWWLAGLGWTVQATTYPAFADVDPARWTAFHARHSHGITLAVGPVWAVQGAATLWWLVTGPGVLSVAHAVAAAAGVGLTVAWAVPYHQRLAAGFSPDVHRSLLRSNAARSVAFTAAAALATAGVLAG
ncbi:hypothetical protein GCM10027047_28720 [Rhodococcus aerolatus]